MRKCMSMCVHIHANMDMNVRVFLISKVRKDHVVLDAMLPIFFLTLAFTLHLPTSSPLPSLNYYDANSDLHIIREWYNMVKIPLDGPTSMMELCSEANDKTGKMDTQMIVYLQKVTQWQSKCASVPSLTVAECLVVMMYKDGFYREYDQATTNPNWT